MIRSLALLAFLLLARSAWADCAPPLAAPGPGVSSIVWKSDRRAVEALLGTPIDDVICASMRRVRRFGTGPLPKRGFLVLTPDELILVSDGKAMEILFRTALADVRGIGWNAYPFRPRFPVPADDAPLEVTLYTEAEGVRLTLPCAGGADRFVDELVLRTASNPGIRTAHPPGMSTQNACP